MGVALDANQGAGAGLMVIVLVRHADAEWVDPATGRIVRDPSLSARGGAQLPHLCHFIETLRLRTFIYSPQKRVVETLDHLRPALGCVPEPADWLGEIRYPNWQGERPDVVFKALEQMDSADARTRWLGLRGGENLWSYTQRVRRGALSFLRNCGLERGSGRGLWKARNTDLSIGALGHAGSLSILAGVLLGIPSVPWERQRLPLRQSSASRLEMIRVGEELAFSLVELGRDDFIPANLRSST